VNRAALGGFITALAVVAAVIFVGVALTEIDYVNDHPFRYGPAKVIAWAAGGGAVLAVAVALIGVALMRD
jgi:hypothetical protein